ncbi:hypothetical protein GCM10009665_34180 [Kitasatospora nipponensis]|uniref:Carrier domain-containing protein n=1 Tax=Kitasatospora nipponensis TaxID=258049 RepID=A0ABN1WAY6_9ACTN
MTDRQIEETLCGLLAGLFGVERVEPRESFVGLGGDSIIAVQLVGAARRAGLRITVREVLTQPDVAALAAVAQPMAQRAQGPQDGVGTMRPTPIMHWLRERGGPAASYYQFTVLRTPAELTLPHAHAVLQAVLDRHDVLRLRLTEPAADPQTLPVGAVRAERVLTHVDAAGLDDEQCAALVEREVHAARDRLAPAEGTVVQAVWFDAGAGRAGRLALVINHLVVDGISWRVLTGDLAQAWAAVAAGGAPRLEAVPTSFRRWSQLLTAEAAADRRTAELPYWQEVVRPGGLGFTQRPLDAARDHEDTARHLVLTLPTGTAAPLLTSAAERLGADANEVLLTALALALADWLRVGAAAGAAPVGASVLVELEGHGREEIVEQVDLSRTVGWFTTLYPARFELAGLAGGVPATVGLALRRVKEVLRRIPDKGIGYGLLRHLHPDGERLAARPELGFNYLGRFPVASAADWQLLPEYGARLDAPGPGMPMAHPVELNAITLETADGPVLHADWAWAEGVVGEEQVRGLAESWFRQLAALVAYAEQPAESGPVAADLTLASIDQDELDDLAAALEAF